MKAKTLLFILLLFSAMVSAQVKRVAILETVDRENKVSYANKLILRANLSKAITQTSGYEAYDRTDVDAIMSEQNFQRTGLVSNDQIKRLGEMTGANYILVAEAVVVDSKNMFITAKLLDVETARTIMTDNLMMGTSADVIQEGCVTLAKRLFHEEPKKGPKTTYTNSSVENYVELSNELIRYSKGEQKLFGVKEFSYGKNQMDEKMFINFLKKNNTAAYKQYMSGKKLIPTSLSLLGGGLAMILVGTVGYCTFEIEGKGVPTPEAQITMYILAPLGIAAVATSVPLLCVGYTRQKNAINMFNEQNSVQEPALSLNLQASQNGIGLALSF